LANQAAADGISGTVVDVLRTTNQDRMPAPSAFQACAESVLAALSEHWKDERAHAPSEPASPGSRWWSLAEDLIAVRLAALLSRLCLVVRLELAAASVLSLSGVMALGSYAFMPQGRLHGITGSVLVITALIALFVIVSASRDAIM